jgi:hypothetical protein
LERSADDVIGQISAFDRLGPTFSGLTTRGVSPDAETPHPADRPRQPAAVPLSASMVALAPAAMTALIDAQARLDQNPPQLVRARTVARLDRLIASLEDAPAAQAANDAAPLPVRQLEHAREALARTPVDLQA